MLHQISGRCWYMPNDPSADRPTLGYVRGDRLSLRIDAGNSPAHFQLMESAIAAQALPPAGLIALTHSHWDHTYGLCASTVPSLANEKTQTQLAKMCGWAFDLPAMEARLASREDILFCHEAMLEEYSNPCDIQVRTADIVYDKAVALDLGGVHAEILRLENSHAEDCSIVFIPEERVVFLGDITYEDLHHDPPCWHLSRFEALRQALRSLDFVMAVPGHQPAMTREELFSDMDQARCTEKALILP